MRNNKIPASCQGNAIYISYVEHEGGIPEDGGSIDLIFPTRILDIATRGENGIAGIAFISST